MVIFLREAIHWDSCCWAYRAYFGQLTCLEVVPHGLGCTEAGFGSEVILYG